ncbi:MAG: sulfotransferase family 2 domain-containing protein [Planctomycetota bacterium]
MNVPYFEWIEPYRCQGRLRKAARAVFLGSGVARWLAARAARGRRDGVFVWVPKNAGTSLYEVLAAQGCIKLKTPEAVRAAFVQRGLVTFGHMSYTRLVAAGLVSADFDERAFRFGLARNPYTRAVSLWQYLPRVGLLDPAVSFETFCHLLRDGAFEPPGLFHHRGLSHCNPQVCWLAPAGEPSVDFIGRVEALEQDSRVIFGELGLEGTVGHRNRGAPSDPAAHYDGVTKALVRSVYEADLDRFAYTFPKRSE